MKNLVQIIKRFLKAFSLCALFFSASAPALKESELSLLYKLLEKGDFYTTGDFPGENKVTLRYAKFGTGRGRRGSLVFINGKGENIFKYIELFYDLYHQGYSPIYTYDHRGQGFSDRILPDSTVLPVSFSPAGDTSPSSGPSPSDIPGYVKSYTLYRKDLKSFVRLVLKDPETDRSRLFLTAHSMGAAVVLDYLQTHPETQPFQAVTLSTPMIKAKSGLFPPMETATLSLLKGFCALLPCSWKLPSLRNRFTQKTLTDSKIRYNFSARLTKKMFPQAASTGTSFRWIIESFKITDSLMEESRIKRLNIPLIILQSGKDRFVSNESQNRFCEALPLCCRIVKIDGKHELFMERDPRRDQALEEMTRFFMNSPARKKQCRTARLGGLFQRERDEKTKEKTAA